MSLLERLLQGVNPQVREEGEAIAAAGRVRVFARGEDEVIGTVLLGAGRPRTVLDRVDGKVRGRCSCGRCDSRQACEHVVATALVADALGMLKESDEPPARPRSTGAHRWLSPTGELRAMDRDDPRPQVRHQPAGPTWQRQLTRIREATLAAHRSDAAAWPPGRQVIYIVDLQASIEEASLVVRLALRDPRADGQWSRPRMRGVSLPDLLDLPDADDRRIVALLRGASAGSLALSSYDPVFAVAAPLRRHIVESICATGRAVLSASWDASELTPLRWEPQPWELWLEGRRDESLEHYVFSGALRCGERRMPLSRPLAVLEGTVAFLQDTAFAVEDGGAFDWIPVLRGDRKLSVPIAQGPQMLEAIFSVPVLPRLDLPDDLTVQTVRTTPRPILRVRQPRRDEVRPQRLRAILLFDYDGAQVAPSQRPPPIYRAQERRLILRDVAAEAAAARRLAELGLRPVPATGDDGPELWFNARHLPRIARLLVEAGWTVEAAGQVYRRWNGLRATVTSGIDWFELRGEADFDGVKVALPALLAAARAGARTIMLDDGSVGLLPEDWLRRCGLAAAIGSAQGDWVRFERAQLGMLDLLLSEQAQVTGDEAFELARRALCEFDGVREMEAPAGFVGELRHYQREGLGWFAFLRRFGFGGCLADDMGLGKTIQVLALLEARRAERAARGEAGAPSLVVVPRSLVFNWRQEARRFTPALRVLDHTGMDRLRSGGHLSDYDLVLTTYGTLRRDAAFLKDVEFDYVVLDEAQAVKNAASESAKAVRLVRGRHRLALSGTPVQNHLGELWSLFDFLNPGMMGAAALFSANGNLRNPDPSTRTLLAKALRPFILRRTKEQVAPELPPRVEQTLTCELEAEQRRLYDELRDHYRGSLLGHIDRHGISASRMQVLEALLRLRQAALHPGLLDPARRDDSSAKLELLLMQLAEVMDEGHKALVFSQFTSMLSIVRQRLDARGAAYEYLDGRTRDRQQRIERFQNDPDCRLFLISLKAGGLGLNLTAADYVFLLDPWWNPAIEAQAIDRTHRIGQTKPVYACRIIARDTVEEKIVALQESKRDLADAIITANNSLIRTLGREELELLLS